MAQFAAASDRVHFPGLNGLRFYAALSVLIQHAEVMPILFGGKNTQVLGYMCLTGPDAVNLFFVLSGFLITYLLLAEREGTGNIHVGKFYVRRALRIWPLYFLIVALAFAVVPALGIVPGRMSVWNEPGFWNTLLLFVLFLPNVALEVQPPVACAAMLWSVGVEEQFYLMWPHFVKRTGRFLFWCLIALIVGKVVLLNANLAFLRDVESWPTIRDILTGFRLESLGLGGIGAYLVFFRRKLILRCVFHPITQIAAGLWFVGIVCWWSSFPRLPYLAHSGVFLVVIMNVACNPRCLISLERRFLDFGGKLSYGIYMFHPILMFASFSLFKLTGLASDGPATPAIVLLHDALTLLATMTTAWLSYRYFEMPFLRLKDRFAMVPSAATAPPSMPAPREQPQRLAA